MDSGPMNEQSEVVDSTRGSLGWRGWIVLLALAVANLLIVAILYQSFVLGE